ncbi:NrfD/PsrC family molybdoenzyme membrane anchor subunit [Marinithermus hydrothermalis]|uniref:Polysulphide reductase NrfD n=1 Tax=Marinithermus hydrothermalis (strain DSM 14884 / JCM 11576 / T1) TaxID=869210 RepID=F2NR62_MARHT|nr:NrfD/PsrC family molybdoenzyme membrane anchor subunit [Marinithermus hydrothermalis]AEB12911.1 Polysulphide reductase NrfD [Marinithermus hydrothermalis DSM 14884]
MELPFKPRPASSAPDTQEVLIEGEHTYTSLADKLAAIVENKPPPQWYPVVWIGFLGSLLLLTAAVVTLWKGVGIWGLNQPVAWGFAIMHFVWWIGIGHAGTLISAILVLARQDWRDSLNRITETMTLFAVLAAGLFPILHLGRPENFYWIIPYPNNLGLWPQFKSPLTWDVLAVMTYLTVSTLFLYLGLIPDLALLRERARNPVLRFVYGALSLGWTGSAVHWHRYRAAYVLLAGLATPLVISVHSVVSLDFAYSLIPGWHLTLFPPFFASGAIYSGFAMALTLVIPLRAWYKLEDVITPTHLEWMARILLAAGLGVTYVYVFEFFTGWYSGEPYELGLIKNRVSGPYAPYFWAEMTANVAVLQLLWFPRIRKSVWALFVISIIANVGMWLDRFDIVVMSLNRDFLPSSWQLYFPTFWDWALYIGTLGFYLFGLALFVRFFPPIAIAELLHLLHKKKRHH